MAIKVPLAFILFACFTIQNIPLSRLILLTPEGPTHTCFGLMLSQGYKGPPTTIPALGCFPREAMLGRRCLLGPGTQKGGLLVKCTQSPLKIRQRLASRDLSVPLWPSRPRSSDFVKHVHSLLDTHSKGGQGRGGTRSPLFIPVLEGDVVLKVFLFRFLMSNVFGFTDSLWSGFHGHWT